MNPHEIKRRFPNASNWTLAVNAQDYGKPHQETNKESESPSKPCRAITMNKTEREYFEQLKLSFPNCDVRWEAYTLRLANRATYTPDFAVISCGGEIDFYEVKGAYIYPKALVKLRIAAEMFPHRFYLAQKKKHNWTVTDIPKRS